MFKTKICGVTSAANATLVWEQGVDALGLNFYAGSKRFVTQKVACEIGALTPQNGATVGVFVNASSESIRDTAQVVSLDYVQLHGDEPPEFLSELSDLKIIRAFRCKDGLGPVSDYLAQCQKPPTAVLVDAYDPHEFGGTGKTLHWPDLASAGRYLGDLPLILAGGLTPSNVAQAIQLARPDAVDTASGVESAPGRKDAELSRNFIVAANQAFSR